MSPCHQVFPSNPVFSKSASPVNFIVPRFQPPVLELEKLPQIDYILISHDHYDHLDMETVLFFKEKNVRFITPLGVTSHLKKWGISESNMFELDWWDSIQLENNNFQVVITSSASAASAGRAGFPSIRLDCDIKT